MKNNWIIQGSEEFGQWCSQFYGLGIDGIYTDFYYYPSNYADCLSVWEFYDEEYDKDTIDSKEIITFEQFLTIYSEQH